MKSQNYSNHTRWVPFYHFFTLLGSIVLLVGSIINLTKSGGENLYNASLIVFGSLLLLLTALYARVFALKAQDRAIRSEENFRHYVLTGQPLDSKLSVRQIIGLRFASDKEFPDLAKRAISENLSENAIKKVITDWREDTYRV